MIAGLTTRLHLWHVLRATVPISALAVLLATMPWELSFIPIGFTVCVLLARFSAVVATPWQRLRTAGQLALFVGLLVGAALAPCKPLDLPARGLTSGAYTLAELNARLKQQHRHLPRVLYPESLANQVVLVYDDEPKLRALAATLAVQLGADYRCGSVCGNSSSLLFGSNSNFIAFTPNGKAPVPSVPD